MKRESRIVAYLVAIPVVIVLGYAVMRLLSHVLPIEENSAAMAGVYMLLLIVFGLGAGYVILKSGFHAAKLNNARESEFEVSNIPQDKQQLHNGTDFTAPPSGETAPR